MFLAAGPLWLERGDGGLAVRFNRTAQTWGGIAAAMPPDGVDLRRRFSVMVAGGPLASLLLRSVVAVEAAWLRAARGDVDGAHELLPLAAGPFVEEHALRRARAEALRAGGDLPGARAEAVAGLAALGRARFGRPSARDRELLEAVRDATAAPGPGASPAAAG